MMGGLAKGAFGMLKKKIKGDKDDGTGDDRAGGGSSGYGQNQYSGQGQGQYQQSQGGYQQGYGQGGSRDYDQSQYSAGFTHSGQEQLPPSGPPQGYYPSYVFLFVFRVPCSFL
jgi:hypothetical protein